VDNTVPKMDFRVFCRIFKNLSLEKLEYLDDEEELLAYLVTYLSPKLMNNNMLYKLLILMMICSKGLTFKELKTLT